MSQKWFKSFSWNTSELITDLSTAWESGDNIALFNPVLLNLDSMDFSKHVEDAIFQADSLLCDNVRKIILCTSGSQGFPKLVLHTESTIRFNIDLIRKHLLIDNSFLFLGTVPLFHAFGLNLTFLNAFIGGDYQHVNKSDWNHLALHIDTAYRSGRKVFLPLVPQMVKNIPESFVSQVKGVSIIGGDVLSNESFFKLKKCFPRIGHTIGYGMTEAGPVITHTPFLENLEKVGMIGHVISPIKHKIIDETLRFKSPGQALYEYVDSKWRSLENRWIDTGDVVKTIDGNLVFLGRKKNILKINSETIFPEQVLLEIRRLLNIDLPMKLYADNDKLILYIADCDLDLNKMMNSLSSLPSIYRPSKIILTESLKFSALGKTTNFAA